MKKYRILRNCVETVANTYAYTVLAETPEAALDAVNNFDFLDVELVDQDIIEVIEEEPASDVDITEISDENDNTDNK